MRFLKLGCFVYGRFKMIGEIGKCVDLIFREKDKFMIVMVVMVVCCCLECGVKLNYFEVIVLIFDFIMEGVWDGCVVVDFMEVGVYVVLKD